MSKIVSILGDFMNSNSLDDLQKLRMDIFDRLLHNYNHFWGDFRQYVIQDFNNKIEDIMK